MFFYFIGSGRTNGYFLAISIFFIAIFSACQPDIEEVITQRDVDYLDSLLAEKRGVIISPAENSYGEDAFFPWLKEHEQAEFSFHQDTTFYTINVTLTLRGTGFRQDNIVLNPGYGLITDIKVTSNTDDESLVLEIDTVAARNEISVNLNRFVQRNEQIRLHYNYMLPLSAELLSETGILPFSKTNSDNYFWIDRPEWIPLLPPVVNAVSEKNESIVSKEWQIHVQNGFKAESAGHLMKETHTDSISSYYFIEGENSGQRKRSFLAIIPDLDISADAGLSDIVVHGVREEDPRTSFFLHQLEKHNQFRQLPGNWYFWDYPFHISFDEQVFAPSLSLIDSTVYPDISNEKLFGILAAGKVLNLPPAKDYPSLLFTDWLNRITYFETTSEDEKYIEVIRFKQKLRSEMDLYMRSVFEPQNDSLSFYFDAHQVEKGFLALNYLKAQFETDVWEAFIAQVRQQEFLSEENLKRLLSEYSGEMVTTFWQDWFYSPGFPLIYTELFTFENEVNLKMRQIRSHSTLPVFDLKIPVRIEGTDGEKRDTVFHFHTQDTLFVFQDSIRDVLIDPEFITPANFHHKRDTSIINHRLQGGNSSALIPLLNANSIPGNDRQRIHFQEILFDEKSVNFRPLLLNSFLSYGVVEGEIYEKALGWDGRSKAQLLQFARTDSSGAASRFTTAMMNDGQLFVRMEAIITAVIRGMADPVVEISTLSGAESYRDLKNKTAVYVSAFLEPNQQKNILMTLWNSQSTTDETRMLILNWLEKERNLELFEPDLTYRFWESKHLGLKKRILKLIAQKGEKDYRLAIKKDLLKIAPHYWVTLFQEAERGAEVQNDQSRQ
jgi:hypothetical protein